MLLQRLKVLRGVGGQLRFGLPPQLEVLEYTAGSATSTRSVEFNSIHLDAAAEAICCLPKLSFLRVQHSLTPYLPFSFVSGLPPNLWVSHGLVFHDKVCSCRQPVALHAKSTRDNIYIAAGIH